MDGMGSLNKGVAFAKGTGHLFFDYGYYVTLHNRNRCDRGQGGRRQMGQTHRDE